MHSSEYITSYLLWNLHSSNCNPSVTNKYMLAQGDTSYLLTKHHNVNVILMMSAQSEKASSVPKQSIVISSQVTDVGTSNKYIATLNMTQLM